MQMRILFTLLTVLGLALGVLPAEAVAQFGKRSELEARFVPEQAAPGDLVELRVEIRIAAGYYYYAPDSSPDGGVPSRLELTELGGLVAEGELEFDEPKQKWDDVFEVEVRTFEGKTEFRQRLRVPDGAREPIALTGAFHLQACDDSTCVFEDHDFEARLLIAGVKTAEPAATIRSDSGRVSLQATVSPAVARPGERVTLKLRLEIGAAYYWYAPSSPAGLSAAILAELPEGLIASGELRFPEPEVKYEESFEDDVHVHHGMVSYEQDYEVGAKASAGPLQLKGTLEGQACDDSTCTNESVPFSVSLTVLGAADSAAPTAGAAAPVIDTPDLSIDRTEPAPVSGGDDLETMPMGGFLLLAVFWGLVTLLMPCTYPMIPITISFFTKQAIAREGKILPLALAYGAGIVLVFILIGVVLGAPIIAFATHPVTNLIIGGLFLFFALVLFGVIDLQPPRFLMAVAGKASTKSGLSGVFLMGTTLVITSFTCTAPFVGSLLSVGAEDGDMGRIILGMGVFGLTMATPFVFLSLLPGRMQRMPQAGEWMHVLKVFLGFVELAAALKFFSNSDLVWNWQFLSRELFLLLWFGIFAVAGMFLFGWIHLKGESEREIGPVRMVSGVGTILFALYCLLGAQGFVLDDIMTAIAPNYSHERLAGGGAGGTARNAGHQIVKDDYERARKAALDQDKLLLVNFTGHT